MSAKISSSRDDHERQLVRAFLLPQRQERYLELLFNPRRRDDVTSQLVHFKHLDMRWVVDLPPSFECSSKLFQILKEKGEPDTCWAISEDSDLDGKELLLSEALNTIVGREIGTFLSCLPGRLAYFEDEDERWILERKAKI